MPFDFICPNCQSSFTWRSRKRKYCSYSCRSQALVRERIPPLPERFWRNVDKQPGDACWEWTGHRQDNGYGVLTVNYRPTRAHRISYELHNGPIPKGMFVCHTCDTPACVRPDHLFSGTNRDNMHDAAVKGRTTQGERHAHHKLAEKEVVTILSAWNQGAKQEDLARQFSVARTTIENIVCRRSWRHVPLPSASFRKGRIDR